MKKGIFANFPNKMSTPCLLQPISSAHTDINGDWVAKCCTTLQTSGCPYEKQYSWDSFGCKGLTIDCDSVDPPTQYSVKTKGRNWYFGVRCSFLLVMNVYRTITVQTNCFAGNHTRRHCIQCKYTVHMHLTYLRIHARTLQIYIRTLH